MSTRLLPEPTSIQEYHAIRSKIDQELFKSVAFQILKLHGLVLSSVNFKGEALKLFPDGTNIVFSFGHDRVIKLFPPVLKHQYISESLVLTHLHNKLSIPTPDLEFYGEFEGWPYLVMSRVEGNTLENVWSSLQAENKLSLIREIGSLIKEVHVLSTQGLEAIDSHWPEFIEKQKSQCLERHRVKKMKPELLEDLPAYLATAQKQLPQKITSVLLTGEYTPFNLLVKEVSGHWILSSMIDFGDCMLGHCEYDLLGPASFLIQGDPVLFREFLISYGYRASELGPELRQRLMVLLLLHRFSDLKGQIRVLDWESQVNHFSKLENLIFGF